MYDFWMCDLFSSKSGYSIKYQSIKSASQITTLDIQPVFDLLNSSV